MLSAFARAIRQVPDPAFLGPLVKGLLAALAVFLGLAGLAAWGLGAAAGGTGWLAGVAAAAGGLAALGLAVWLFVPVMIALSGLFLNPVADAVERRFYPALPPPAGGAGLAAQARFNIMLGLKMGALALLALPFGFLAPPLGAVLLWTVSTLALGYGLFEGVAQRRMDVAAARRARMARRWRVLGAGGVLAAMALVPGLNLLVPVLGTAVMTHLLHRS